MKGIILAGGLAHLVSGTVKKVLLILQKNYGRCLEIFDFSQTLLPRGLFEKN
jgi:hypothetical protein